MELIFRVESIRADSETAANQQGDIASAEALFREPEINESFIFTPLGGLIGRSSDCDWVLNDDSRRISGKHASILFEDQQFFITDLSTNGILVNEHAVPLGKGHRHAIVSGDYFLMAGYQLSATIVKRHCISSANHHETAHLVEQNDHSTNLSADQEYLLADSAGDLCDALLMPSIEKQQTTSRVSQYEETITPQSHDENADNIDQLTKQPDSVDSGHGSLPDSDPVLRFMEGAGLDPKSVSSEEVSTLMGELGGLLKCYTEEVMSLLMERSRYKNRFRLDMTLVGGVNNNPLKYCVNDSQALREMVISPQPENLSGVDAIKSAMSDIKEHFDRIESGYRGTLASLVDYLAIDNGSKPLSVGNSFLAARATQHGDSVNETGASSAGIWHHRKLIKQQKRKLALLGDTQYYEDEFLTPRFAYFYQRHQGLQAQQRYGRGQSKESAHDDSTSTNQLKR